MIRISTGERARFKQALLDFRAGRGEQDADVVVDSLLADLSLVREETPEVGQSAAVNDVEAPQS